MSRTGCLVCSELVHKQRKNEEENRRPKVRGSISITEINPQQVEKYGLRVGMITPNTSLRITE